MKLGDKIALAGVFTTVIVGIFSGAFSGVFNDQLRQYLKLDQAKSEEQQPKSPETASPAKNAVEASNHPEAVPVKPRPAAAKTVIVVPSQRASVPEALVMDYEDLQSRFSEVEKGLRTRMADLRGTEPKPDILSALTTCRQDLAAAKIAMEAADTERAKVRLNSAKAKIVRLESL